MRSGDFVKYDGGGGLFEVIRIDEEKKLVRVRKVVSKRGVVAHNARSRTIYLNYLTVVPPSTMTIPPMAITPLNDPTGYWERKTARRAAYFKQHGKKLIECWACMGSGRYDMTMKKRGGGTYQPECSSCNGTGRIRE